MKEEIELHNKPYVVIEGIYNDIVPGTVIKNREKVIFYSGMLMKKYGLLHLLNAFDLIKERNIQLWICGFGDARSDVEKAAKKNKNIKYLGQIPREQVLKIQQEVSILINPRYSSDEYTFFSFPSKTMEYMASGTPVLMHKLKGIPEEYHEYIYFCLDESDSGLKNKIIEIFDKSEFELSEFGGRARNFILKNKNAAIQTAKIIEMFKI
jgi:glycosyltransferase involved in cell wall biosynthesis